MNLLCASLRTIFYDANISEVIEEIKQNKSVFIDQDFKDIIKWNETAFSSTELGALSSYIRECTGLKKLYKRHSMLNLLNLFTQKHLTLVSTNGVLEPQVNYSGLLEWRELSLLLGEDILTLSFMADIDNGLSYPLSYYTWPNILNHNYLRLSNLLSKGLTDIHAHLKASADTFELTWISFMNRVVGRKDNYNALRYSAEAFKFSKTTAKFIDPVYLVRLAAGIRFWIFEILIKNRTTTKDILLKLRNVIKKFNNVSLSIKDMWELQARINISATYSIRNSENQIIDYAITSYPGESVYGIHLGERQLLHSFFYRYYRHDRVAHSIADYVFLYILIKIRIRKEFIQTNALVGFDNFKIYENRKCAYCDKYINLYERYAVQSAIRLNTEDEFEGRVTVGNVPETGINKTLFGNTIRKDIHPNSLTFVIHLIKAPVHNRSIFRNAYRNKYHKDIEKIMADYEYRKKKSFLKNQKPPYKITGIDAAGSELDCLPETFGHVFRYARKRGLTGLTYHVGEDFYDLADGLRIIDEAVAFLNLNECGRLGHATALGVDVERYYSKRNFQVVTSKQRLLDTIVWLKYNVTGCNFPLCLGLKAQELFYEIGYSSGKESIDSFNSKTYYLSQRLRSDDDISGEKGFSLWSKSALCMDDTSKVARNIPMAKKWANQYLLDIHIIRKGNEKVLYEYPPEIIGIVKTAQDCMLKRIAANHILVECNPSSNFKIGHIDRYEHHHIFPLQKYYIDSSIGTDDKGIFATSLYNEFSIIAKAALNMGMSEDEMIALITKIKETARRRKFKI